MLVLVPVVEEGEGKNGEMIWLWEALTACGVLPGDLCALARAIYRYGTGKKVGSASCSKPRSSSDHTAIAERVHRSM